MRRGHEALRNHPDCDIMAGRFSYPLIELGCFGMDIDEYRRGCYYHRNVIWADYKWLKLLCYASLHTDDDNVAKAVADLGRLCWTPQRMYRLRTELQVTLPERSREQTPP